MSGQSSEFGKTNPTTTASHYHRRHHHMCHVSTLYICLCQIFVHFFLWELSFTKCFASHLDLIIEHTKHATGRCTWRCVQVHERQINRMRTRSEWFLGCGDSLNSEMNLCVSGIQTNTVDDVSRGNYATDNICDHNTNDSGSLRTGICMCAS